ncbi:MAG: cyclic nucleotide-binding domain-containing protein [Verrucomicrobia bacterium]|nr:cyclic nucleotide-binding domain-containing protein [Verrucomicrobiota bacterium]MBI3867951.1 cyclic nucleotide-binding domain-containing protein [Verrucomicrobiota bacterium]
MEPNTVAIPESLQPLASRIERHPFFTDLPRLYLPTLATTAMSVEFQAEDIISNAGDLANRFYLIEEGHVRLSAENADGAPVDIMTLGPGQVLGWSWLFPPHYWTLRAEAVDPVKAIFLYGTRLREWADADPQFGYALMKQTAKVLVERLQGLCAGVVRGDYGPRHPNLRGLV